MLGDNEYNGYTDIIEEIKGLAQQMQTGFETLMKALEGMNTKNTVCKSTFTSHQAEYVKYNDKILQLFIREDNTPLLVNVKDEDEIYDIDNFCLYSYQQVRLNRILGRRGWFNTNGATMSGIRVMKLQESNMWMQDPDDSTEFIPNMEWRFSTFHAELISYMNNNENIHG